MLVTRGWAKLVLMAGVVSSQLLAAEETGELQLVLPPSGYAVVGQKMSVYIDNTVLIEKPTPLELNIESDLGGTVDGPVGNRSWTFTPHEQQVGAHSWNIRIKRGDQTAVGTMSWVVSPAKVTTDREVSLLIIGDSLTHATLYPNELSKLLTASGVNWKMFGTHRPSNALPGVAHEGYGGWRWETFLTHFEPNPEPDKSKRKYSSPFVFQDGDKPKVDVPRFLKEACGGKTPDFVIFKLGINDAFGFNASDLAQLDGQIDGLFKHADTLVKAFRETAPNAKLGICLTTPGNARDESFQNNYEGRYPRWGWKRIQHRLVERQIKHFRDREKDHIHIIPTELNLDTADGYPELNSVHPNEAGYQQIAASIHAWLMSRLTSPR